MSNDKEFEETKIKSEIYIKSFGHISNLEERGLAQDAFSTAWDYQQKIIEQKDKEISELVESLKEFNIQEMRLNEEPFFYCKWTAEEADIIYSVCVLNSEFEKQDIGALLSGVGRITETLKSRAKELIEVESGKD